MVVFEQEHYDNIRPEECHQKSGLTGTSEAKLALSIGWDIAILPKGSATFEGKLDEGKKIDSHACHKRCLVGQPAVANQMQSEHDEDDGIVFKQ